jgi:uncharacterized membrane protein
MPGRPPAPSDHVKKADANKHFGYAMNAKIPTAAGWALVAMFYSALHYAEAYLLKTSRRVTNHEQRLDAIKFDRNLTSIYAQYRHLSDYGYNARYNLITYGQADVDKAKPSLEAVERHIKSLL